MKHLLALLVAAIFLPLTVFGAGSRNPGTSISGGASLASELPSLASKFSFSAQDENGWSILKPSSDSRLIYVSSSGNDRTARTYSPSSTEIGRDPFNPSGAVRPYASIDAALAQARANYPDYILLKRGDTWANNTAIRLKAGRSATERLVLGYYGDATARPIVLHNGVNFSWASYSAIIGIRFYAPRRDPGSKDFVGFANVGAERGFEGVLGYGGSITGGILIEDCWFDWFSGNALQSPKADSEPLHDIILRRNIITNSYSTQGHTQGLYTVRVSLWLEENIFDHNGWYKQGASNVKTEGTATMFNHNTYFTDTHETVFRNNLFLRASSAANKFTSNTKSGKNEIKAWDLLVDNNLYIEGEIGISIGGNDDQNNGPRWRNIHVTNNVMQHIGRTQPTLRTLGWGLDVQDWDSGKVSGNIFANWGDGTKLRNNYAINVVGDTTNVSVTNNIVYNVSSTRPLVQFLDGSTQSGTEFSGNDVWTNDSGPLMAYSLAGGARFGNNYFQSAANKSQWFIVNGATASLDNYRAAARDTTSVAGKRRYVAPERTIETYLTSIGRARDMDSFVAELRTQSKFHWVPALGANAINSYFRAGFESPRTR
jgi:hypothetical protein